MIINKLYSILVSGSDTIPNTWFAYRKYTEMPTRHSLIPVYTDPFRRSVWANYMIEMSKLCEYYPEITKLDELNTYKDSRIPPRKEVNTTGCSILKVSEEVVAASIQADIIGTNAVGTCNEKHFVSEIKGNLLSVSGIDILLDNDVSSFSIHIINPYAGCNLPSRNDVKSVIARVTDPIRCNLDITKPQDLACGFCIGILNSI